MALNCAYCKTKECTQGKDCVGLASEIKEKMKREDILSIQRVASSIESLYYMKKTRIEEVIEFCHLMGYKKVGIAFCVGLSQEAYVVSQIFKKHFDVVSVCCKVCGVSKDEMGFARLRDEGYESACNPVAQAEIMNREKTDLNIIVGLCIGHDIVFTKESHAPVTTLIVKDRVLAHNPAGYIYSGYYTKRALQD